MRSCPLPSELPVGFLCERRELVVWNGSAEVGRWPGLSELMESSTFQAGATFTWEVAESRVWHDLADLMSDLWPVGSMEWADAAEDLARGLVVEAPARGSQWRIEPLYEGDERLREGRKDLRRITGRLA